MFAYAISTHDCPSSSFGCKRSVYCVSISDITSATATVRALKAAVLLVTAGTAAVTIRGGKIVAITDKVPSNARYPVIDYKYAVISPGVIDVHVHMNEPGREHWEGVWSHLVDAML